MNGKPIAGRHKNALTTMAWMEGVQREDDEKRNVIGQEPTSADFAPESRQTRLQEEFAQVSRTHSGQIMFERST